MKLDYVNCQIGTLNCERYSNGNIYPICAVPFGMANFTVQTTSNSYAWFYSPKHKSFEGIRLTHQASPWVNDYGHMLFFPYTKNLNEWKGERYSSFDNDPDNYKPYKLAFYLNRFQMNVSLTPTTRGAIIRLNSKNGEHVKLAIMPYAKSFFELKENVLTGYTDAQFEWGFERIREYFYMDFSAIASIERELENNGVAISFNKSEVEIRVSTSFISQEQAYTNYISELNYSFESVLEKAKDEWEQLLSKIDLDTENENRLRTFYSSMYRCFLYPMTFYENKDGMPYHFNADLNEVRPGVFYTNNGFWDTYRTVYPLFNILIPEREREMIEGFVNFGEETGYLPKWLAPGEIGIMPGSLCESVIASAAINKVIDGPLLERAYKLLLKNAFIDSGEPWKRGRMYLNDYLEKGYVSILRHESINNTLDNAYGDYCIAQVAKIMNDYSNYDLLMKRSNNYRNLFDSSVGFFRGKDDKNNFRKAFNPIEWGGDNCEGSYWQNSFAVYHDIQGLSDLHGGNAKLENKLDELFNTPPVFEVGEYKREIHEMSEMAACNLGQCAISNQPSFHIPWIYSYIGAKNKTIDYIQKIVDSAFNYTEDGYPGDEDNGSMAACYVFMCLGFYPVCPASKKFALSKTLFDNVKICGKRLEIPKELNLGEISDILK